MGKRIRIQIIPAEEKCEDCGKDLSKSNRDTIIEPDGKRHPRCEDCFKEWVNKNANHN